MDSNNNILNSIIINNDSINELTLDNKTNNKLIYDLCKILNIENLNINLKQLKDMISPSYDILTTSNKKVIEKLINSISGDIKKYIDEIVKDGKLDINDLEPLCGIIKYLVENFNKVREIKNIEPEIIIIVIKLIVIIIIQISGNIEEYKQIINLAFICLKMVIGYTDVKKCFFLCN